MIRPFDHPRSPFGHFTCHFPELTCEIPFKCLPRGNKYFHFSHQWVPKDIEGWIFEMNGIGEWFAFPTSDPMVGEIEGFGTFTKLLSKYHNSPKPRIHWTEFPY